MRARMESLENTLSQVVQRLRSHEQGLPAQGSPGRPMQADLTNDNEPLFEVERTTSQGLIQPLTREALTVVARAYLKYCECQPIPLFDETTFVQSLPNREPELVYSVFAIATRFCDPTQVPHPSLDQISHYCEAAYRLVMTRLIDGNVELSTLQTLCLLSLLYLDLGRYDKSHLLCSQAASLAKSARLYSHAGINSQKEETSRCFWGVVLLCRFLGQPEQLTAHLQASTLPFPSSPSTPGHVLRIPISIQDDSPYPFGIMQVVCQLSSIWSMALNYVQSSSMSPDKDGFPWKPDSLYARTTAALMDLGLKLPLAHRYRSIKIPSLTDRMLEEARPYWGPWFLSRMMYHTILCILNHPLLLTLQIRGVHNASEAFLQQTLFSISNHVTWVMHFIQLMRSKQFSSIDSITIYCVAVVATVELQRSFSRTSETRNKNKRNFEECVEFIETLGNKWMCSQRVVKELRRLEADMSSWSRPNLRNEDDDLLVDVSGIFGILDFATSFSELSSSETMNDSIFGPLLGQDILKAGLERPGYTHLPGLQPVHPDVISCQPPTPADGQTTLGNEVGEEATFVGDFTLPVSEFFGGPFHELGLPADDSGLQWF
ncbi:hypothetical protein B0J15DRAFT_510361 [Fusarium solani]|uniref:Xylanolytic transcriptional activator regulatory domain-containing protein n=1 Tax=Fusarium solani TaxID=169388 RepID=A0A9P9KU62_FUSSL|nr:uncharacterized protein B0J15DRAFT_510361 [Fusarium solani]KAH7268534.1 hypothetical protein B0J15DRAFT_510361 [Fusarium solani]